MFVFELASWLQEPNECEFQHGIVELESYELEFLDEYELLVLREYESLVASWSLATYELEFLDEYESQALREYVFLDGIFEPKLCGFASEFGTQLR